MNEPKRGRSLPWFRVDNDVVSHPKIGALCRRLKSPTAGWHVVQLWSWTMRYAPLGRLAPGSDGEVEQACNWRGAAGELWLALHETGWLRATSDGGAIVHDWSEHQGAAVTKAQIDRDRKRELRNGAGTARAEPAPNPRQDRAKTAPGSGTASGWRGYETGRDETGRDETRRPTTESGGAQTELDSAEDSI